MNSKTQCQVVLAHLKSIGPLTQWGAIRHYKITRLGARIWDLERAGYEIDSKWIRKGQKRFKEYAIA